MKKTFKFLGALVLALGLAGLAWAATDPDTYDTPASDVSVGGVPMCITFSGTSGSSTSDLVVTVPTGFTPTFVEFWQDYDVSGGTFAMQWFRGMPLDSGFSLSAAGDPTYVSSNGITYDVSAKTITVASEMQIASGNYVGRACR